MYQWRYVVEKKDDDRGNDSTGEWFEVMDDFRSLDAAEEWARDARAEYPNEEFRSNMLPVLPHTK